MWIYAGKRMMYGLMIIITVVCTIASIIYLSPVDPARLSFGQMSDVGTVEAKRKAMGLDQPLPIQLMYYLRDVSPVNVIKLSNPALENYSYITIFKAGSRKLILKWPYLRESYQSGRPVSDILKEAIPLTLILAICSILLASFLGIALGILAAIRQGTWIDQVAIFVSTIGFSLPSYATAIFFAILFAFILKPLTGLNLTGSLLEIDNHGNWEIVLKNLILPVFALGLRPVSIITQLTRSAMLDNMSMPYVRTAKAKGLGVQKITYLHVLKNALNPIITGISGWFASLVTGAFFVENVFNYRGLGLVTVKALLDFDIPVVLGAVIFTCIMFVVINILVDLMYVLTDPRIKY
ncbi:MAG: ABC transporter permease [Saprospiraceae bacterium]|jgi:peptide/nickel transport system permease protein|nr:MAG: binding-protein-dependent transport system inner membrane protein [Candidatus Parvibacillus calidus]MBX2936281.1 ABC transporter permease [Saprospiraceae bacterium]MBX7180380.1 ABC transporter permease [Saprospiraceae bacterium]MCB0590019.1 ABC transporter permease [Saprospiraceae bacterium]MCO5283224.1 ABC transporter permease [Saprospiraceae bacterium]